MLPAWDGGRGIGGEGGGAIVEHGRVGGQAGEVRDQH